MLVRRTYKYRAYLSQHVERTASFTLTRCLELYNAALQEWREAYRLRGVSLNYYDQANQLSAVKEVRLEYKAIHSQVLRRRGRPRGRSCSWTSAWYWASATGVLYQRPPRRTAGSCPRRTSRPR